MQGPFSLPGIRSAGQGPTDMVTCTLLFLGTFTEVPQIAKSVNSTLTAVPQRPLGPGDTAVAQVLTEKTGSLTPLQIKRWVISETEVQVMHCQQALWAIFIHS